MPSEKSPIIRQPLRGIGAFTKLSYQKTKITFQVVEDTSFLSPNWIELPLHKVEDKF